MYMKNNLPVSVLQGCSKVLKSGGQVVMQSKILTSVSYKAPSDLPKSGGGAAAPPAPPFAAPLQFASGL